MYKVLKDFKVNYKTGDVIPLPEDKAEVILNAGGYIEKIAEAEETPENNKQEELETPNEGENNKLEGLDDDLKLTDKLTSENKKSSK